MTLETMLDISTRQEPFADVYQCRAIDLSRSGCLSKARSKTASKALPTSHLFTTLLHVIIKSHLSHMSEAYQMEYNSIDGSRRGVSLTQGSSPQRNTELSTLYQISLKHVILAVHPLKNEKHFLFLSKYCPFSAHLRRIHHVSISPKCPIQASILREFGPFRSRQAFRIRNSTPKTVFLRFMIYHFRIYAPTQ